MPSDAAETPPEPEDPLLGALVSERYKIVRVLGDGGMGRVYEAEHVLIKRRVALKCLHAQYAMRADVVARFRREALAATAIHNKHIVEVTDMGRFPDGRVFLVLELLDGRDLAHELVAGGALSFPRAVHVAAQLCDGLGAAHAAGIVHRDLKPENVFLITRDGDRDFVKIVDFGISKFKDGEETATDTGVILGTPMYMAPEQVQGQKTVDHRADLYAVGVILFRALTGRSPFTAPTPLGLVYQVCTVAAPSVTEHRPDTPPELAAIVARLMEKDPERRFQSAAALGEALRALEVKEGATPPAVTDVGNEVSGVQRTSVGVESAETLPATPARFPVTTPAPVTATPEGPPAPPTKAPRGSSRALWAAALVGGIGLAAWGISRLRAPNAAPPAVTERPASWTPLRPRPDVGPDAAVTLSVTPPPAEVRVAAVLADTTARATKLVARPHMQRAQPPPRAPPDAATPVAAAPLAAPPPSETVIPPPTVAAPPRRSDGIYTGPRGALPETL